MKAMSARRASFLVTTALVVATAAAVVGSSQTQLQFGGMLTVSGGSRHKKSGMLRQPDCSITQYAFSPSRCGRNRPVTPAHRWRRS